MRPTGDPRSRNSQQNGWDVVAKHLDKTGAICKEDDVVKKHGKLS